MEWDRAIDALADGATLVTANARLARRALGDEATRAQAGGTAVWRRGDALPWTAWLQRVHRRVLAAGVVDAGGALPSAVQARAIWQQVIEADIAAGRAGELLQPAAAVARVEEAHALCLEWRLDRDALARGHAHEDVAAFLRWSRRFEQRLAHDGWLDPAALADHVAGWLQRAPALRPPLLCLAGFEEFTPQQRDFIASVEAAGVDLRVIDLPAGAATETVRVGCADAEQEMVAAAHWARRRLDADPGTRLGIVVRDLGERRAALLRQLERVLEPAARRTPACRAERPWNVSLGAALADEPLIHDALLLLRAAGGELEFGEASRLLRSPFIGGAVDEARARLNLEARLRDAGEPRLDTAGLLRRARAGEPARAPDLAHRLKQLLDGAAVERRRSPAHWARAFADWLSALGWPGERGLDSREYQALGAWRELLQTFATLAAVVPAITRAAAVGRLHRLATETPFQPRTAPAPVQVLGLLEAIGQRFDAVWIMGLHDEVWPESPRPNPFLPASVQREHGLPHASAARERAFAERLTGHLVGCAPRAVISWPTRDNDRPLRPSPLIVDFPLAAAAEPAVADDRASLRASRRLESWVDDRGPPLAAESHLRGGTGAFRDQSQCPFRAFALHRLGARALESPAAGLDPRLRGRLVHDVLHAIWSEIPDRAALAALAGHSRRAFVGARVEPVLEAARAEHPRLFTAAMVDLERRRLTALIDEWLDCELSRPDFRVEARERDVEIAIGGVRVGGRIDRIDVLPDGGRVVIDYKTGEVGSRDWLGQRPQDPQLPLYTTVFDGDGLAAVAAAQVRPFQCGWAGVARAAQVLPTVAASDDWPKKADGLPWADRLAAWRAMAEQLAGGLRAGDAAVDPLPGACDYCHLAAFCRIHERATAAGDADD